MTARARVAGGLIYTVRFLIKAGIPFWYREPVFVIRGDGETGPSNPDIYQDTIPNYDPWGWRETCPEEISCLDQDPFCVTPPLPPIAAPAPPDPCFPNDPRNNPPGQPGAHRFTAGRSIFAVPRGTGTDWGEKVPIIRLYTGSLPWKRLTIRWYHHPKGGRCDGSLDPCDSCAEINLPWLPRHTLLTIDGRVQRALVDCPGPRGITEPRLYGPFGGPLTWPVFQCASPLCCEVIGDATSVAPDSWMDIHMATREDAI